jgi:integrase
VQRAKLTDLSLRALKPASPGKRYEIMDALIPEFGVRVTDKGAKSFIVYRRWPGSPIPTRRKIGNAAKMKLSAAREKAREWLLLVDQDKDPRQEQRQKDLEEQKRRGTTFGALAEAWFQSAVKKQRKGVEVEADVRREFVSRWGKRPVTEITTLEIANLIREKGQIAPAQTRNLLGYIKRLFKWAVEQHIYGLEISPAASLSANALIGKKRKRTRSFSDDELKAFWLAAKAEPYPYGPLFRMLALTGQRRTEVGSARWSEFDLRKRLWVIPAERMKMDVGHVVPLSDDVIDLLNGLPRFNRGNHLFSTDSGVHPVNGYGNAKQRIEKLIGEIPHWQLHDIRRTMRTNLGKLRINKGRTDKGLPIEVPIEVHVRERMIAHAQPGVVQAYDQFEYLDEKREGFDLWAARLRSIVEAGEVLPQK